MKKFVFFALFALCVAPVFADDNTVVTVSVETVMDVYFITPLGEDKASIEITVNDGLTEGEDSAAFHCEGNVDYTVTAEMDWDTDKAPDANKVSVSMKVDGGDWADVTTDNSIAYQEFSAGKENRNVFVKIEDIAYEDGLGGVAYTGSILLTIAES